jgi:hypothetical protein
MVILNKRRFISPSADILEVGAPKEKGYMKYTRNTWAHMKVVQKGLVLRERCKK